MLLLLLHAPLRMRRPSTIHRHYGSPQGQETPGDSPLCLHLPQQANQQQQQQQQQMYGLAALHAAAIVCLSVSFLTSVSSRPTGHSLLRDSSERCCLLLLLLLSVGPPGPLLLLLLLLLQHAGCTTQTSCCSSSSSSGSSTGCGTASYNFRGRWCMPWCSLPQQQQQLLLLQAQLLGD